jgi:hypothetical protein
MNPSFKREQGLSHKIAGGIYNKTSQLYPIKQKNGWSFGLNRFLFEIPFQIYQKTTILKLITSIN